MNTLHKSKTSDKDLKNQIEQHLEELAQMTDKARSSEAMLCYLEFCAKFHQYSAGNIWLILLAKPDASNVAGYNKWKSMGRWVRQGEHGIPILAPVLNKAEDEDGLEEKHLVGFRVVYVFDVSQTDGEPLPPVPDWRSPVKNDELNQRLIKFARSKGISVIFNELEGDTQGVSKGGEIIVAPNAGTKTLVHEIAHELMHQDRCNQQSRAVKELEAESVAYVVSRYCELGNLNSPNYIALFDVSSKEIMAQLDKIRIVANEIINAIDPINKECFYQ